jgi:hypothetical protein
LFRVKTGVVAAAAAAAGIVGFAGPAFATTAATAATATTAATTSASVVARDADGGAVFVQTDNTAGNQVVAYRRAENGALTQVAAYNTGGLGGILAGSAVDHLASQGSLAYDRSRSTLIAVNAGSNTVSVFGVHGDRLRLRQVIASGGTFPVSVAVHGDLVYVLNALGGGSVQGFRLFGGFLGPIPGSSRALGLDPTASPQFTHTPGQVAFTPSGSQLVVTTKANGNDIDVFAVHESGRLSAAPVVNPEPGTVPFAIGFDVYGNLVIANAGPNSLATFALSGAGALSLLDSVPTGQAATCWVAPAGKYLFAGNAGSGSETGFTSSGTGQLTSIGNTATDKGTVDAAAAAGGRFLYVQTGAAGIVDEYSVAPDGSLTQIGSVTVPGAVGGEGIVAS